jgi:hypothetical protein
MWGFAWMFWLMPFLLFLMLTRHWRRERWAVAGRGGSPRLERELDEHHRTAAGSAAGEREVIRQLPELLKTDRPTRVGGWGDFRFAQAIRTSRSGPGGDGELPGVRLHGRYPADRGTGNNAHHPGMKQHQ